MPEQLRKVIREKFLGAIVKDPAILVADDVIALSTTLDEMQAISDTCCTWAEANGLNWNPQKSQLLRMIMRAREARHTAEERGSTTVRRYSRQSIILNGTRID